MRLPRDLSGRKLADSLKIFGYQITRQTGSHIRLTTQTNGEHNITIPNHEYLRIGMLSRILKEISEHLDITRNELLKNLNL